MFSRPFEQLVEELTVVVEIGVFRNLPLYIRYALSLPADSAQLSGTTETRLLNSAYKYDGFRSRRRWLAIVGLVIGIKIQHGELQFLWVDVDQLLALFDREAPADAVLAH